MAAGRLRKNPRSTRRGGRGLSKKQSAQVKGQIERGKEKKHFQVEFSSSVGVAGLLTNLSSITQGDSGSERVGDSIKPHFLELNLSVIIADTTNVCRVSLIQWKQDSADATPTLDDIFSTTTAANAPHQPFEYAGRMNFKVLGDKMVSLGVEGPNVRLIRFRIPASKMLSLINFDEGAATGRNKIYMVLWSDSGAVTHPVFTGVARLLYSDS